MEARFIYQDIQRGVFYLINKETGSKEQAFKNGQLVKKFKIDVTGNDYKIRKTLQFKNNKKFQFRKHQPFDKTATRKNKLIDSVSLLKKTVQDSSRSQRDQTSPTRKIKSKHDFMLGQHQRLKSVQSQYNFVTNYDINDETDLKRNKTDIRNLLQSFSKIKEEKLLQNHSPFKKSQGRVPQTKLLNSKGFRQTQNILYQPVSQSKKFPRIIKAEPKSLVATNSIRNQLSKERKIFLQSNPSFEQHENPKVIDELIDRKKNFKRLEALYLQEAEKETSKIYSSIPNGSSSFAGI